MTSYQRFKQVFSSEFNPDTIDLSDTDRLRGVASVVLIKAIHSGLKPIELFEMLTEMLGDWKPEFAVEFSSATDIDWQFDHETEHNLKLVLQHIAEGARFRHEFEIT